MSCLLKYVIKGIRKAFLSCQNGTQKGKRLDLRVEPIHKKLFSVPPPPGLLLNTVYKNQIAIVGQE